MPYFFHIKSLHPQRQGVAAPRVTATSARQTTHCHHPARARLAGAAAAAVGVAFQARAAAITTTTTLLVYVAPLQMWNFVEKPAKEQ